MKKPSLILHHCRNTTPGQRALLHGKTQLLENLCLLHLTQLQGLMDPRVTLMLQYQALEITLCQAFLLEYLMSTVDDKNGQNDLC